MVGIEFYMQNLFDDSTDFSYSSIFRQLASLLVTIFVYDFAAATVSLRD